MQNKSIKIIAIFAVLALIVVGAMLVFKAISNDDDFASDVEQVQEIELAQNDSDEITQNSSENEKIDYSEKEILKISPSDMVIGDKNAPVVMIEYASLSCPHCASFYREAFPKIKEKYIDTNKVVFVFRDFPLNEPALVGASYARCLAKEGSEKYFATIKNLFKVQDSWAFDGNFVGRLEAIASLDGINSQKFNDCINNKEIQDYILKNRIEVAQELQIKSVPSFFINNELSSGYIDYITLERLIEKKLSEQK